jgi:hypothetical protein
VSGAQSFSNFPADRKCSQFVEGCLRATLTNCNDSVCASAPPLSEFGLNVWRCRP